MNSPHTPMTVNPEPGPALRDSDQVFQIPEHKTLHLYSAKSCRSWTQRPFPITLCYLLLAPWLNKKITKLNLLRLRARERPGQGSNQSKYFCRLQGIHHELILGARLKRGLSFGGEYRASYIDPVVSLLPLSATCFLQDFLL